MNDKDKRNSFIYVLILVLMPMVYTNAQSLNDYRWKNRLLFVLNPDGQEPLRHEQVELFRDQSNALKERQLLIMILHQGRLTDIEGKDYLLDPAELAFNNFKGVILIGKDGGTKLREPFTVDPQIVFNLIDSMPMRRAEIKASEKN